MSLSNAGASLALITMAAVSACASRLVQEGVWFHPSLDVRVERVAAGLALDRDVTDHLIEDAHGPAGAHQDITGSIVVRKVLYVPPHLRLATVTQAVLEVNLFEAPGNSTPLRVTLNGGDRQLAPGDGPAGRYRWREIPLDPSELRSGENVVTLSTVQPVATAAWAVLTRRSAQPDRSARSLDGGQTWDRDTLSTDGLENGEYTIRLRVRMPASATVFSEIRALPAEARRSRRVWLPEAAAARYQVRTGPTAVPGTRWSGWIGLEPGGEVVIPAGHVYVQTAAVLDGATRSNPARVHAVGARIDAAATINAWLPYGSRFRYQDPRHPTLQVLREREALDRVVASVDEEVIVARLRDWARRQFGDGDPNPYPPLNALTILDWIRSGKTQGFCGQHAYLLGQALLSFGLQVRYVELGMNTPQPSGPPAYFPAVHFAVEYWSPALRKWVYVDPNKNLRVTLNGRALSALEIHDLYMEYFEPAARTNPGGDWKRGDPQRVRLLSPEKRTSHGLLVTAWELLDAGRLEVEQGPTAGGRWGLDYFYYVRVRMRSDELMHPSQFVEDLPAVSARHADGFDPNGMLDFVDPRAVPLKAPIGLYTTSARDAFDWRLDLVDVSVERTETVRIRVTTAWPYPANYVLRGPARSSESRTGEFIVAAEEDLGDGWWIDVLDSAGRVVTSTRVARP